MPPESKGLNLYGVINDHNDQQLFNHIFNSWLKQTDPLNSESESLATMPRMIADSLFEGLNRGELAEFMLHLLNGIKENEIFEPEQLEEFADLLKADAAGRAIHFE